jgi:hypothetical protein
MIQNIARARQIIETVTRGKRWFTRPVLESDKRDG